MRFNHTAADARIRWTSQMFFQNKNIIPYLYLNLRPHERHLSLCEFQLSFTSRVTEDKSRSTFGGLHFGCVQRINQKYCRIRIKILKEIMGFNTQSSMSQNCTYNNKYTTKHRIGTETLHHLLTKTARTTIYDGNT